MLKLKGRMAGYNDGIHARVATVLFVLFDEELLKTMSWGTKNGVPKAGQLCVVDYPKIIEIFRAVLSKENDKGEITVVDDEKIRHSIQSVFKNHIKKKEKPLINK